MKPLMTDTVSADAEPVIDYAADSDPVIDYAGNRLQSAIDHAGPVSDHANPVIDHLSADAGDKSVDN
jgi:hypothetical protein